MRKFFSIVLLISGLLLVPAAPAGAQSSPVIRFSTYLGGSGADNGAAVAIDSMGSVYVVGDTTSANFPASGTFPAQSTAMFVTRFDPTGRNVVYSTFLGQGIAYDIAVDGQGYAYVTGLTSQLNTTPNAFQPDYHGNSDAFIAKIAPSGGVIYATYLGGAAADWAVGLALDAAGNIALVGETASLDFPLHNPYQPIFGNAADDLFVAKMNAAGSGLIFSTYYAGAGFDMASGVAVDGGGNVYVGGNTNGTLPVTAGAFQTVRPSGWNGVVAKFSAAGSLVYATYLGGSGDDYIHALALDSANEVVVVGETASANFPLYMPYQGAMNESAAFVSRLSADGTQLTYSTYFGGLAGVTAALDVAVDRSSSIYVSGMTTATDFPTVGAIQPVKPTAPGDNTAFVTRFTSSGHEVVFSTYFGGSGPEVYSATAYLAVDNNDNIYLTGTTYSDDFPVVNAYQSAPGGVTNDPAVHNYDAFVAKLDLLVLPSVPIRNYFTTDTPTLTWTPITGTTHYRVQVSTDKTFSGALNFEGAVTRGELAITTVPLPNGVYYWHVQAQKLNGDWTAWSPVESFTIYAS